MISVILRGRLLLLFCLIPVLAIKAAGMELDPEDLPPEWSGLFEGLRDRLPLRAAFIETRRLPFRSKAVVLEGTLRLDPVNGVSLHYPSEGKSVTNLVDDAGLATRRDEEAWRPLPDRPEIRAIHEAIAALLTLDLQSLARTYVMDGTMDEDGWHLHLRPRPESETGRLKGLSVAGNRLQVTRIEASLGKDRGFVIEILDEETQVTLLPEEYALYFR